eukprot:TRINITY_DN14437_c0_g1_i2.p1 TRINITY_DN14437_c0_g1~~TRINITY_DN14437_c0_g1_i2.p1  ORF type:complete len:379 (-),score=61.74 TRINITY_DN14437_c0_g1_i2:30-1166(-)
MLRSLVGSEMCIRDRYHQAREYPVDCGLLSTHQPQNDLAEPPHLGAAINSVCFDSAGKLLCIASNDCTARVLRLPCSRHQGTGITLVGHDAPVRSIALSRDDKLAITSSADCTARIWSPESGSCHFLLRNSMHNNPSREAQQDNVPLAHEVKHARFLYLDKFIALSSGSRVFLYNYYIHSGKGDDIKHLQAPCRYKAASVIPHQASTVTALTAHNRFMSTLLLTATSHHKIHCHDLGPNTCVTTYENTHSKTVQSISLHQPSVGASHPQESYELFLTAAPDDSMKLWDLRSPQKSCVRLFKGHSNRFHAIQCSFSPCLRYVGCGSEDQRAYLYDLGSGKVVERLRGHGDAVVDVQFNPVHPQLVTACLDGNLRFFSDQ